MKTWIRSLFFLFSHALSLMASAAEVDALKAEVASLKAQLASAQSAPKGLHVVISPIAFIPANQLLAERSLN